MKILNSQLKILTGEENSLYRELADIPDLLGQQSLVQLFWFGRFIEHTLLLTFEKKLPLPGDIEKYLTMAKETYDSAMAAWKKYGFYEKSENFKKSFGQSLEI